MSFCLHGSRAEYPHAILVHGWLHSYSFDSPVFCQVAPSDGTLSKPEHTYHPILLGCSMSLVSLKGGLALLWASPPAGHDGAQTQLSSRYVSRTVCEVFVGSRPHTFPAPPCFVRKPGSFAIRCFTQNTQRHTHARTATHSSRLAHVPECLQRVKRSWTPSTAEKPMGTPQLVGGRISKKPIQVNSIKPTLSEGFLLCDPSRQPPKDAPLHIAVHLFGKKGGTGGDMVHCTDNEVPDTQ